MMKLLHMKYNPKLIIVLLLGLLTLLFSVFINPSGHFSVDEGIYHLMTRSFSDSGSLEIWNGYVEYPSPELVPSNVRAHEGRLIPQYPYLYPVLASPFYSIAGYHGLFILNAIAFIGVVWLCFALARKLFDDLNIALNSCLIFIFATYAWEYSQAAWPHAVSMFFSTGAVYFALISARETSHGKSVGFALAAGAMAGFGAGVRLDVVFVLPAIMALLLFVRPWQARIMGACLGTAPGLVLLTATNYLKFGEFSPFSYGRTGGATAGIGPYLPMVVLALVLVMSLWLLRRHAVHMLQRPRTVAVSLLILGLGMSTLPAVRHVLSNLALGAYQLIVDLRVRSPEILEPALTRSPNGAMVYLNMGLKKSLLQSCPYLPALLLPLARMVRKRETHLSLSCLYLVPVIIVGVYSYFAWHGGLCFNLRYFLPILPFTSIIVALAWRELAHGLSRNWRCILMFSGFLAYGCYCLISTHMNIQKEEAIYLTLPIILATLLLFFLILFAMSEPDNAHMALRGATSTILVITLVWSGLVALHYDFARSYALRASYSNISQKASVVVSSDSILFTDSLDAFFGLGESDRVRLAMPSYDNFESFRQLVDFHIGGGRPVYLSFNSQMIQSIEKAGLLDSLTVVPLLEHQFGTLVQVVKPVETLALDGKAPQ